MRIFVFDSAKRREKIEIILMLCFQAYPDKVIHKRVYARIKFMIPDRKCVVVQKLEEMRSRLPMINIVPRRSYGK